MEGKLSFKRKIIKDKQIRKFLFYEFFKNLKFFEPFLLVHLVRSELNLFQWGLLLGFNQASLGITNIYSRYIGSCIGRKNLLYFSYLFYMTSFLLFFLGDDFRLAAWGMIFLGLGQGLELGTNKNIISDYLYIKNWQSGRLFLEEKLEKFSLLGKISGCILGVGLIFLTKVDRDIFLFSILSYFIVLMITMTYPEELNYSFRSQDRSPRKVLEGLSCDFCSNKKLTYLLIGNEIVEASLYFTKDIIQLIFQGTLIGSSYFFMKILGEDSLKLGLYFIYLVLNLCDYYFFRRGRLLKTRGRNTKILVLLQGGLTICLGLLGRYQGDFMLVLFIYTLIYSLYSIRRPVILEEIDNNTEEFARKMIISAGLQIRALFLVVLSPILGYLGNEYGLKIVSIIICVLFIVSLPLLRLKKRVKIRGKIKI